MLPLNYAFACELLCGNLQVAANVYDAIEFQLFARFDDDIDVGMACWLLA